MKNKILEHKDLLKLVIGTLIFILSFYTEKYNLICVFTAYVIISFDLMLDVACSIVRGDIFNEKFLMLVATYAAFKLEQYNEAMAVMLFYSIGELLNDRTVSKSKRNIIDLMNLKSDTASVIVNGEEKSMSPTRVKVNDVIIVRAGEKIPLDGIVIQGNSSIDTSSITGESKHQEAIVKSNVMSGTINLNGTLMIKVTAAYKDSTVGKILNLIENSDTKKSETEKFITKFAKVYTPVVVFLALLIFAIPSLITKDYSTWGYRSLVFLVTSCPCALVLSIPLAYFAGIGTCSKNGILIKNSSSLDKILEVDEAIFDKTGTITEGTFEVVKVKGDGVSGKELLEIAAMCECQSNHPIALSIKEKYGKEINVNKVKNYKVVDGGITATIGRIKYILGNYSLLSNNKIKVPKVTDIGTVVYVAKGGQYLGYILIADKVKASSKKTITELKRRGVKEIVILSGDNEEVVKDVCKDVGISRYSAGLLPQDKVTYLKEAKKEDKIVMFVGDGINDAPALMTSNLAVSMGGIGSDAAIEASDMVIMNDDLSKLNKVIDIANETKKIVWQNIVFALATKIIVLILAMFGLSNMLIAVFADVGVTLLTVLNTIRIIKKKVY